MWPASCGEERVMVEIEINQGVLGMMPGVDVRHEIRALL